MSEHKYYTDWSKFWDFYMQSAKDDIGEFKFQALKNSSARITQNLKRISDDFRLGVLDDLIREAGMIPNDILLYYDPKATTFYSAYSRKKKRFYIGYPTFTKYMCYWEPAMKAAFRHEMGHILRGDCLLTMPFSDVRNANCCMDIRINDQLSRSGLLEVYKCMNFKDKDQSLLVPEEQFGKIDLPYDADNPYIPEWWIIANKFNKANKRQKQENDKDQEQDKQEPKDFEIGDYVIIDTNESPYNGDPGKIVDIDEEGNYVVESISEEEFNSLMDAVKESRMQLTTSGDLLGVFTKSQIISAIPEEEGQQGEYGDDGEDEGQGGDSGGDDDDDGESGDSEGGDSEGGESGDGEGGDSGDENKTPEEIIKEKEEILEDLLNGGVDGNNQGDGVWSDELSEDEDEDEEDGSGSGSQSDTEEDESKDGSSEENEGEGEGEEEGEGEGEGKAEGEGKGEKEKEDESDFDVNDIPDWTEEQTKRKEDLEEKIKDINLTKNINKSIDNFNSIKQKHKDKLTKEEMMYIDVALEELEELKQ